MRQGVRQRVRPGVRQGGETSFNNIEYFPLEGCVGTKRPIHTSRENKVQ